MKKINNKGFVLAETLVVTVFLMTIFGTIYANYFPLVGEYEKREYYDSVDGKYSVFWLKRMIEDSSYNINSVAARKNLRHKGYTRFECSDVSESEEKRRECISLVKELQVNGCDGNGNLCDIYITKYRIGDTDKYNFKKAVLKGKTSGEAYKMYEENCYANGTMSDSTIGDITTCKNTFVTKCINGLGGDNSTNQTKCNNLAERKVFTSGFKDYILASPDYSAGSLNYANYRVIAIFHNTKDNNNYYSYATIEVDR